MDSTKCVGAAVEGYQLSKVPLERMEFAGGGVDMIVHSL